MSLPAVALLAAPAAQGAFERDQTKLPDAVSGAAKEGTKEAASSGSSGAWVRLVVGLLIVLVVLWGVYWILKRWTASKARAGQRGDGRMAVVATTALAQNRAVHLVRVGDDLVLLGSAEHQVTPIRVYRGDAARRLEAILEGVEPPLGMGVGTTIGPVARDRQAGVLESLRRLTARS
ncbi:MAG: flagellar biosynthetic protein FliO [Thermoleophilia bacterium]